MGKNNEIKARVVIQEKGLYTIKSEKGEKKASVSGKFRFNTMTVSDYPVVGDYVHATWSEDDSNATINEVLPRSSCFLRKAAGTTKDEQAVASNIDYIFLCMSVNNDFNVRKMERYLAIAWDSGSTPIIVLTKADLCDDIDEKIREIEEVAIGVEILVVSSLQGDFEEVYRYIKPGMTVAFIGSSGVGKSTLINKLIGEEIIATKGIRNDDKGRHTTTRRELIDLENGASVVDTPGMREFGMFDASQGIETAFNDIEELEKRCKFSDCTHNKEPGCAVQKAIQAGLLSEKRLASYRKLKIENLYASDGSAYMKHKKQKFKEISKLSKQLKKSR